jgi:hypothetical protein
MPSVPYSTSRRRYRRKSSLAARHKFPRQPLRVQPSHIRQQQQEPNRGGYAADAKAWDGLKQLSDQAGNASMAAYSGEVLRNLIRRALPMSSLSAKLKSRVRPYDPLQEEPPRGCRGVRGGVVARRRPHLPAPLQRGAVRDPLDLRHGTDRWVIAPAVWGKTRPSPHPGGKC